MTDWFLLSFALLAVCSLLDEDEDDDQGGGGGLMQPAYQRAE